MSTITSDEWNRALAMRGGSSSPYGRYFTGALVGTWWPYNDCPAPSRSMVGESLWGKFTAEPVHMAQCGPDSFKIYVRDIDGINQCAGYVQYDLDEMRYVTRDTLHGAARTLTFTTFGRAVEQVQIAYFVHSVHNEAFLSA